MCPFSRTKTLGLHPDRAADFAYMAQNRYTTFPCHKTAEYQESDDGESDGYVHGKNSKSCHGFRTLQCEENGLKPDDFKPDGDGFQSCDEMIDRHEEIWEERHAPRKIGS
jgi:hypothetical protein